MSDSEEDGGGGEGGEDGGGGEGAPIGALPLGGFGGGGDDDDDPMARADGGGDGDDIGEYEVERILGERTRKRGNTSITEYHVAWRGYTETTWEPLKHVRNCVCFQEYMEHRALHAPSCEAPRAARAPHLRQGPRRRRRRRRRRGGGRWAAGGGGGGVKGGNGAKLGGGQGGRGGGGEARSFRFGAPVLSLLSLSIPATHTATRATAVRPLHGDPRPHHPAADAVAGGGAAAPRRHPPNRRRSPSRRRRRRHLRR